MNDIEEYEELDSITNLLQILMLKINNKEYNQQLEIMLDDYKVKLKDLETKLDKKYINE